jgi:TRAP-type C4-dicarboxylate transport system substrate-binding protein
MLSINLQGWNKLTDEQRKLVNQIISELVQSNGEERIEKMEHKEHEHLEIEHWFTGEL